MQRRRPPCKQKAQVHSQLREHEVSSQEINGSVSAQSYGRGYFLPSKLAEKAVTFLLDTGCTTNLLSRCLFDALSARDRASLKPYEGEHGTLVNGLCISFYGVVETFIVSQLKEDAILGMPFLKQHRCHIDFKKSPVVMVGRELTCVNQFG